MYDRLRAEGNELIALVGHFDKGPGDSSRQPTPPCDMMTHNNRRLTCGCVLERRAVSRALRFGQRPPSRLSCQTTTIGKPAQAAPVSWSPTNPS